MHAKHKENVIHKTQRAFTIVELLVVIVVIGILAAISIVTYSGIQKRAQTIAYTVAADSAEKQLRIAITQGEDFSSAPMSVCYGRAEDYPATSTFSYGQCYKGSDTNTSADPSFTAILDKYSIDTPTNLTPIHISPTAVNNQLTADMRGINLFITHGDFGDGSTGNILMMWSAPDPSSCGRGKDYIENIISVYKGNPQYVQSMINTYGPDWENILRGTYGGAALCSLNIPIN
jgi:prepilin-type N-terminal cleavage/methylation domain-containing protein